MSFEEYLNIDAINVHGLMAVERSPAHYWHSRHEERKPDTPAKARGRVAHMAILEPHEFEKCVPEPKTDGRTRAGREEKQAFLSSLGPQDIPVPEADYDAAEDMRDSVMSNRRAQAFLADGEAEKTLLFDVRVGVQSYAAKARLDWLCEGHDVVVDVKTADDASFEGFSRAAARYRYHMQAAWYLTGVNAAGFGKRRFIFLVVENTPPYAVALYELDQEALISGANRLDRVMSIYAKCLESGIWPGYDQGIQELSLPRWAL